MIEIVKLTDAKFVTAKAYTRVTGYALKNEEGYIAFPGDVLDYGIRIPYMPRGGKAALQEILNAGWTGEGTITIQEME